MLFQTDDEAIRKAYVQIASERAKLGEQESVIHVTVTGVLRLKDHYDVGKTGDGTLEVAVTDTCQPFPVSLSLKL